MNINTRLANPPFPISGIPFEYLSNPDGPVIRPIESLLRTDMEETDDAFNFAIEVPGIKKEGIELELRQGKLVVSATNSEEISDEADGKKNYVCRERYCGMHQRSFYVGNDIDEDNIKAEYENGVLKVTVPKKNPIPHKESKKYIEIN